MDTTLKKFLEYVDADLDRYEKIIKIAKTKPYKRYIIGHAESEDNRRLILTIDIENRNFFSNKPKYEKTFELKYIDTRMLPAICATHDGYPLIETYTRTLSQESFEALQNVTKELKLKWITKEVTVMPQINEPARCIPKTDKTCALIWPGGNTESYSRLMSFLKANNLGLTSNDCEDGYLIDYDTTTKFVPMEEAHAYIRKTGYPICPECGNPFRPDNIIPDDELQNQIEECWDGTKHLEEMPVENIDLTKPVFKCGRCPAISALHKEENRYVPVNDY